MYFAAARLGNHMQYVITFLEGIVSFISPCTLPLLPVYISFFAGGSDKRRHALTGAFMFVAGFTLVFCLLGVFAGTLGTLLARYRTVVNIICGAVVVIFGLSYLGVIPLNFFKGIQGEHKAGTALSAFVFGMIFSVSLTPCIGAFLGSALMLAASSGGAFKGFTLLLVYSLGLGIPYVISAVLIDRLAGAFAFIKKHYNVINIVCGVFLIVVGVCMAAGWLNRLLSAVA